MKARTVFDKKSRNNIKSNENLQRIHENCKQDDAYYNFDDDLDTWEIYINKTNMMTWRKEEEDGCFSYKGNKNLSFSELNLNGFCL